MGSIERFQVSASQISLILACVGFAAGSAHAATKTDTAAVSARFQAAWDGKASIEIQESRKTTCIEMSSQADTCQVTRAREGRSAGAQATVKGQCKVEVGPSEKKISILCHTADGKPCSGASRKGVVVSMRASAPLTGEERSIQSRSDTWSVKPAGSCASIASKAQTSQPAPEGQKQVALSAKPASGIESSLAQRFEGKMLALRRADGSTRGCVTFSSQAGGCKGTIEIAKGKVSPIAPGACRPLVAGTSLILQCVTAEGKGCVLPSEKNLVVIMQSAAVTADQGSFGNPGTGTQLAEDAACKL